MKLLFVTDLHGSRWKYERLVQAAISSKAEVVINGGDMLPKSGGMRAQERFIAGYLDEHLSRFQSAGITYLCYLGNDDLIIFDELFQKTCQRHAFAFCLAQRKVELGGYPFVGMNWVADYPFLLKDRCRMDTADTVFQPQFGKGLLSTPDGLQTLENWEAYAKTLPTIADELRRLVRPNDMAKAVYVIHMPPCNLGLDKCFHGGEVGSKAVYDFLLKNQPLLSLHGHIHESPEVTGKWHARLGRTLCIQPGQLDEYFTFATINLDSMEFERIRERRDV